MSNNDEVERKIVYIVGTAVRNWKRGADSKNKTYQNNVEAEAVQLINQLLNERERKARIDELKRMMGGWRTIRSYIKGDGREEQIVTYEFANTEIQDRLEALAQQTNEGEK
jgi:hypothetical protein